MRARITVLVPLLLLLGCGADDASTCAANEVRGTTCVECGPVDQCLRSEERCLTTCTSDGECSSPQVCHNGYCAAICG